MRSTSGLTRTIILLKVASTAFLDCSVRDKKESSRSAITYGRGFITQILRPGVELKLLSILLKLRA